MNIKRGFLFINTTLNSKYLNIFSINMLNVIKHITNAFFVIDKKLI